MRLSIDDCWTGETWDFCRWSLNRRDETIDDCCLRIVPQISDYMRLQKSGIYFGTRRKEYGRGCSRGVHNQLVTGSINYKHPYSFIIFWGRLSAYGHVPCVVMSVLDDSFWQFLCFSHTCPRDVDYVATLQTCPAHKRQWEYKSISWHKAVVVWRFSKMQYNILLFLYFAGIEKHDNEGRVITAEFEKFYLVNVCKFYVVAVKIRSAKFAYFVSVGCSFVWKVKLCGFTNSLGLQQNGGINK